MQVKRNPFLNGTCMTAKKTTEPMPISSTGLTFDNLKIVIDILTKSYTVALYLNAEVNNEQTIRTRP